MCYYVKTKNRLCMNYDVTIPRCERLCVLCVDGRLATLQHFVMECRYFSDIRRLYHDIQRNSKLDTTNMFNALPEQLKFYILLGMDYPQVEEDI